MMNHHDANALGADELERYARHIVLPEIGGAGQQRLKRARVLIIGAGGLGAPAIQYLAAAGVGTIGIVDDDIVTLSNLQRQVIHATGAIGERKVDSAAKAVASLNPHVRVETHALRIGPDNADALIAQYDIVADGCDNFATRFAVADAAARVERPLVTAAVGRFDGSITVLKPWEQDADGNRNPSWRDLFPEPPPPGLVPSCAEAGVLGVLTGVLGSLQALEVIKLITGAGTPLIGRLLLFDSLNSRFETITYRSPARKP